MSNDPQHGHANSEPLITAIIPTYRRPRLLKRAIHSVLNQTYPNLQVCVYDNASGDETEAVVREIAEKDPRVKYFCHPTNIGAARNFEYGLVYVNTPYFSLLSDDDVLLPDFYTKSLQAFEKHPDAGFTIGVTLQMDEGGRILAANTLRLASGYHKPPDGLMVIVRSWVPLWTGMLFRREVIEKVGTFDLSIACNDYDYELRAAAIFPYVVFHDPVALFVAHPSSGSFFLRYNTIWPSWHHIALKLKEHQNLPVEIRERSADLLSKITKRIIFRIGLEAVARRAFDEADEVVAILHKPLKLQMHAQVLALATWLSRRFKLAHSVLVFLYTMRKRIRARQSGHLQMTFGHYSSYLRIPAD